MAASHDEEVELKTESTENLFDCNSTVVKQLDSTELLCQLKTEIKMEENFNSSHAEAYSCLAQTTLKSPIKEYRLGLFSNKTKKYKDPNTFSLSGKAQSSEDNCWVKEDSTELEIGVHQTELNTSHSTDEEVDEELWYTGATQTKAHARTGDHLLHTTSSPNSAYRIQNSDLQTDTVRKTLTKTGKKQKTDKLKNCALCGKNFTRPYHLKIHMRIHTGEEPYKCTECGKCFVRYGELSTHMRFHRGEKPYSCSKCSKSFTSSTHLKEHEWTHTGTKPYACSQCEKSYAHPGDLVKHRRIHTGERPYPCMGCGVSFRRMGTLKKHQKRHSRPQSFRCVHCRKVFAFDGHLQAHVKSYCKKLKSVKSIH